MNCLKRSSVGIVEGAVAAGAGSAEPGAAEPGAVGPGAAGADAAEADAAEAEQDPKSISKAVKPLDSIDLLGPVRADHLDVAEADLLATPWVASPRTGACRREGAIESGDGERNFLPSKRAG